MKSDRRTLVVAAVFLCFLAFIGQLRSQFLYGARLATGGLTAENWSSNTFEIGSNEFPMIGWSLKQLPTHANNTRTERLGLALVQVLHTNNPFDRLNPLEEYCTTYPEDLKARAHLLRMAVNGGGILAKTKENEKYLQLAGRLVTLANDAAAKEPSNWYWRERQFHLLFILGRTKEATSILTAAPFPKTYDDYVFDEVECKEALYRATFYDIPESALFEVWGGTLFPHLSTRAQIEKLIKESNDPTKLQVAQIDLGRAMTKASPTAIAAMVGVTNINHGIWGLKSTGSPKKIIRDLKLQALIEKPYQSAVSKEAWDYCLRAATSDIKPNFLRTDEYLSSLYIGQLGPVFEFAGVFGCIFGLILLALDKFKIKNINSELIGWPLILVVFKVVGATWDDWRGLGNYSLGMTLVGPGLIVLALICLYSCVRREKKKRLLPSIFVLTTFVTGMSIQKWEATSVIILLLFAMQRGTIPFKPWTTATGILLLGYHAGLNAALTSGFIQNTLWLVLAVATLVAVTRRPLEPDQPRFATITLGVASLILGTVLTTQYDKGIRSSMQDDRMQTEKVRAEFAKL